MMHRILNGDVRAGLRSLPPASVQCVVTSPPYWGQRDYEVDGQIGLESSSDDHIADLVDVFREVRRVLRDDGTLWLNYGEGYYSSPSKTDGGKTKDLMGIPWRLALALRADGWYLRSDVVWSKPNPTPEPVRDRPTKGHEYLFLLSKSPTYYYDLRRDRSDTDLYRLTVWTIPTNGSAPATGVLHFASFPPRLVKGCILAGTSDKGACPSCGAPWVREFEREYSGDLRDAGYDGEPLVRGRTGKVSKFGKVTRETTTAWIPSCKCAGAENMDPVPCVVLDPFVGSGTTTLIARELGRSSIGIELNPEYVEHIVSRLRVNEQLDSGLCSYVVEEVVSAP